MQLFKSINNFLSHAQTQKHCQIFEGKYLKPVAILVPLGCGPIMVEIKAFLVGIGKDMLKQSFSDSVKDVDCTFLHRTTNCDSLVPWRLWASL